MTRNLELPIFNPQEERMTIFSLGQTNTKIVTQIEWPRTPMDPDNDNLPFLPGRAQDTMKVIVTTPSSPSDEEEIVYVTLKYTHENFAQGPTQEVKMFIIPLSLKVTTGLVAPEYVDFGILTSSNSWAKLPVGEKRVGGAFTVY